MCSLIHYHYIPPQSAPPRAPWGEEGGATMATYHLSTCIISRGRERSVASSLSYIRGERIYDKYLGEWHDNSRRTDVLHKEIYLPPSVPLDYQDPQRLADALNDSER